MAETYQILSDNPNGLETRSVWLLLRNGKDVRQTELVLRNGEEIEPHVKGKAALKLWQSAEDVEDGKRAWAKAKRRDADQIFEKLMLALADGLEAGDDLPKILAATEPILGEDPEQAAIYVSWNVVLQKASPGHIHQLMALMLTVMSGKMGQR